MTLGRALIEVGELDEAQAELERVLTQAPENLAAIRGLAEIHHRRGQIPEATEHYRSALEITEQQAAREAKLSASGPQAQEAPEDDDLSLDGFAESLRAGSAMSPPPPAPTAPTAVEARPAASAPLEPPELAVLERWLEAIESLKRARQQETGA